MGLIDPLSHVNFWSLIWVSSCSIERLFYSFSRWIGKGRRGELDIITITAQQVCSSIDRDSNISTTITKSGFSLVHGEITHRTSILKAQMLKNQLGNPFGNPQMAGECNFNAGVLLLFYFDFCGNILGDMPACRQKVGKHDNL